MGDPSILAEYVLYLMAAGRSPQTVATRRRQVAAILRTVDPQTATRADLLRWLANPRWKPATRASNRAAVRDLFAWLNDSGIRADNPAARLPTVKVPPPVPHPAPEVALAHARAAARGPFEALMVELAARAGMRRREIATLRFSDLVDTDDGPVLRVTGKGGRTRVLPIPPDLAGQLRAVRTDWVFPSRWPGQPMSADHVGDVLSRLLGPGWSGHSLRHRYASRCYARSHDVYAVMALMGHADPKTTIGNCAVDQADRRRVAAAAS
jgi:integrase